VPRWPIRRHFAWDVGQIWDSADVTDLPTARDPL
jgi:hypothetical protein